MVPVTRLPDKCLLALFRKMTLEDQIGARKVCRRWADLVPEVTSKRRELILLLGEGSIKLFEDRIDWALFYNRQSLKLLLNPDGTAMYPTRRLTSWNSLHLDSLGQATAKQIARTFTGVKELQVTVHYPSQCTVDNLAHLLDQWSGQLVTLQLLEVYIDYYESQLDRTHSQPYVRLFAAINGQSALKKLHLYMDNMSVPDLAIVSQLEELHFYLDGTTAEQFVQMLQQYGEGNRNLARIEYVDTTSNDDSDLLDQFTGLSVHLRHRFTRLNFNANTDLATICAYFSGLTSLELDPSHITPRHLFCRLATLHQLIHLSLAIDRHSLADNLEQPHHYLLPQVKSVKALDLKLKFGMPVHQQLAKLKLAWTLPAVEVIHVELDFFGCTECNVGNFQEPSEQAKCCLRQLFAPLKRDCATLRLIEHNQEEALGTAEKLLAE